MNILILGSGGREHTLAWKLNQSKKLDKLFIAPGNAGTAQIGTNLNIDVNDFQSIKEAVLKYAIKMIIIGPEDPLVNGIHDFIVSDNELQQVAVIGPKKAGAQLEGSKDFSKQFMERHNIPTAKYKSFTNVTLEEGYQFLEELQAPYVLKADGLAAGKGVLILNSLEKARSELKEMLSNQKFGKASSKVVIEEFLDGIEMSCFVLTDGKNYISLPNAKDYKRIGEADTGLNTGGMGAISPVPFADATFLKKVEERIIKPTINGLQKDNIDYQGFIFIGLIKVNNEPLVIEYNVRLGDPETEVIIPRLKTDLLDIFIATAEQKLDTITIEFDKRSVTTVMLVSGGYPEAYQKGKEISGIEAVKSSIVFHAGTIRKEDKTVSNGGRVIAVTSFGETIEEALEQSYESIENIKFGDMYYRKDIGFDLI
ncbi:MAG: phosphoribosylamine--glycine ligase [Flavobacteriaceae bacterium]|nr:phosphoribosylamine--glycine ligase [Flavobacteriaceae bacterium]